MPLFRDYTVLAGFMVLLCSDCPTWVASAQDVKARVYRSKVHQDRAAAERLQVPKVALLFLTRGPMPHERSWAAWLAAAKWLIPVEQAAQGQCTAGLPERGARTAARRFEAVGRKSGKRHLEEQLLFSTYVHPAPDFEGYPADTVFHDHEIDVRTKVEWGGHSMVEAMRLLLSAALREPLNQRFAFMDETTVPLYPPTVVYQQMMKEGVSRVDACQKPEWRREHPSLNMDRWTESMLPFIPRSIWLKSSQWASLTRAHAHLVYADDTILHVFAQHCRPPTCVGDEHYLPVLLAYHHEENNTACSGNSVATRWGQDWHPLTFGQEELKTELLLEMRQNVQNWIQDPPCQDQAAIRLAEEAFIKSGPRWELGCSWQTARYNPALLSNHTCCLFARKMSPISALQTLAVLTGCDSRLRIAPRASCSARLRTKRAGADRP